MQNQLIPHFRNLEAKYALWLKNTAVQMNTFPETFNEPVDEYFIVTEDILEMFKRTTFTATDTESPITSISISILFDPEAPEKDLTERVAKMQININNFQYFEALKRHEQNGLICISDKLIDINLNYANMLQIMNIFYLIDRSYRPSGKVLWYELPKVLYAITEDTPNYVAKTRSSFKP